MAQLILIPLSLVSYANGFNYHSRCLLHRGRCVTNCPRKMHAYHTRCDRDTISQRTCEYPYVYKIGYTCGWSRCDCNGDLVYEEENGDCIDVRACPKVSTKARKRKEKKKFKLPRKLKLNEDELSDMNK